MLSSVQAKKWREQNPNYSKNWYQANKERIREQARKKYHESVVAKRLENASAQLDEEEWKQIPDFENYKVNKHGEVKNKFGKKVYKITLDYLEKYLQLDTYTFLYRIKRLKESISIFISWYGRRLMVKYQMDWLCAM